MLYGSTRYAHDDDYTPIARPVTWKGKPAVAAAVAVLDPDGAVLDPQVIASDVPWRGRPAVATACSWYLKANRNLENSKTL